MTHLYRPVAELLKRRAGWGLGVLGLLAAAPSPAQTLTVRAYTVDNGLPQAAIYCLGLDRWGRVWAGTQAGVAVYNGVEFKNYGVPEGLADNHVRAVAPAPDGPTVWLGQQYAGLAALGANGRIRPVRVPGLRLPGHVLALWAGPGEVWVGTETQGLWRLRYAPGRPDTLSQHWSTTQGLPTDSITRVGPGLRGQQWVATPRGLLVFDAATGQPLPGGRAALPAALRTGRVGGFCRVNDSVAWVATGRGLLRVSAGPGRLGRAWRVRRYTTTQGLCANRVLSVVQDAAGQVWANTPVGLCQGVPAADGLRFRCLPRSGTLYSDRTRDVLLDREGNLWVSAGDGLSQYLANERFTQFTTADGLLDNALNAIAQPRPDALWLGARGGISILPLGPAGPRPPARALPVPTRGGREPMVMSLLADRQGAVWVGMLYDGARRYNPRTGRWALFDRVPGLAGETVASIAEDRRGRVWFVTHHQGVTVYDPAGGGRFRTFRQGEHGLPSADFWQVYRDRAGRLWLASDDAGLVAVDTERDAFRRVDGVPGRLSLGSISEDPHGDLWLGSINMGVLHYEPATGRLHRYGPEVGLRSLNPYFVQGDSTGLVWVGTHLGVDVFDPRPGRARSYGRAEGFGGGETNENAVLLDPAGRLWVGTMGGLMLHDPRRTLHSPAPPPAFLTGLRVAEHDTTLTPGLVLPYRLRAVSFDYLGVSLARPGRVRYQYRLRGLADEWTGPVAGTSATFASLSPGRYTFEVRATTGEGDWGPAAGLQFEIKTPWWRTWGAYVGYAALFGLTLYGVRRRTRRQERERAARRLEQQALGHLRELDRVKTEFFTNISHELRTPLTLILGPAELLAEGAPDPTSRQRGGLVLRQARKLLTLINQLLDLSKLDAGALRLHPAPGDVAALGRQLVASFASLAESRAVALHLDAPPGPVPLVFDPAKLDEILTNLLANALRFTPAGGQVTLRVAESPPSADAPAGTVELEVRNTGPGIAPEHLPHLFDRFYQAENQLGPPAELAAERQGTGVGLALVRELVALHGGTVAVQSAPGQGARFVVRLPRGRLAVAEAAAGPAGPEVVLVADNQALNSLLGERPAVTPPAPAALGAEVAPAPGAGAPVAAPAPVSPTADPAAEPALVLIIEDSDEVRAFIAEALAPGGYRLLLAPDGPAGLALARAEVPDLIVSDVMMPGLSGYEVCARLQADPVTSHIPVVLLTARSGADDRLHGLETGAQAYLPKPFRPRELQAQVRSLLHLSQQSRARFQTPPPGAENHAAAPSLSHSLSHHQAAVAALPSLDRAFLEKFETVVLAHLADEVYGVDQLAEALALSRTQLHRKLKALTGQAPGEYLRRTRLHRALALLQARVGSVAEVAYQVGYGSPAHFSTAFSRQFGYPPSLVAKEVGNEP